jgi:hypothetical protein
MPQTITRIPALPAPIVPALTERSTYDATSEVRNVLHAIIGRSDVEATLHAAGLRAGTMTLVFTDRGKAHDALQAHRDVGVFRLVDDDVPTASMYYVVDRLLQLTLDPETAREWLLKVGFQEVIL